MCYVTRFPYEKYMAEKKLNLKNAKNFGIWFHYVAPCSLFKRKALERKGSLSCPGAIVSFIHYLLWEVMTDPYVILKVILVFSPGERWKGKGEMEGREKE